MSADENIIHQGATQELGVLFPREHWRNSEYLWMTPVAVASVAKILPLVSDFEPRGLLPEPIDVPNHVGNLAMTFVILDRVATSFWGRSPEAMTPQEHSKKRKVFAVAMGALTVAANVLAEKVGYGPTSTPDILDFAYGCLGGFLAYRARKPITYVEPDVVEYALQAESEGSRSEQFKEMLKEAVAKKQALSSGINAGHANSKTQQKPSIRQRQQTSKARPKTQSKTKTQMQKKSRRQNRRKK